MKLLYSIIFLGSFVSAEKLIGGCAGTRYGCCEDGIIAKKDYNGINCKKHIDDFNLSGYYGGDYGEAADSSTDYSGSTDSSYQADSSTKTDYASEPDASYSGSNEDTDVTPSSDADDFKDLTKKIAPAVKKIVPVIKKIVSETKKKDNSPAKRKSKPRPKPKPKSIKKPAPIKKPIQKPIKKPIKKPVKNPIKKPVKKINNRHKPTHLRTTIA